MQTTSYPVNTLLLKSRSFGGAVEFQINWGKLAVKITVWLATEVLLSLAGLDNLADYSEFITGEQMITLHQQPVQAVLSMPPNSLQARSFLNS